MQKKNALGKMIESGAFRFERLAIKNYDNSPVLKLNKPEMAEEETCLFHKDVKDGDKYFEILHESIQAALAEKKALPVVRFADGEYAFYRYSLDCNGLYRQAESAADIKRAMPFHLEAMKILARSGKLAPLIFPGNTETGKGGFISFLSRWKKDSSAVSFLDFLCRNDIRLTGDNYIPFYVIYAYLVSESFAGLMSGGKICIVNSEFNEGSCRAWFHRFTVDPKISFVKIPDSYVATRWDLLKESVLGEIPADADLFLVGAGVGALPVCVDLALRFSVPAIDAGHVMNMMNGREDKSKGPRLYTTLKG